MGDKDKVGFTMMPTWFCFSPAKNDRDAALALYKRNMPPFSMASAEYDTYLWNIKMLELCGVKIERQEKEETFVGIPWKFGPKIMIEPDFCLTFKEMKANFEGKTTVIKNDVSMILGKDALKDRSDNLEFGMGTVIARRKFNYFDHYEEDSIVFEHVEEKDNEIYQIRGYKPKSVRLDFE